MARFGEELRTEREARGTSLEALAAETRVKLEHLQALEDGRYREMPGGVFRRGILQAYVTALGLDVQHWIALFDKSFAEYTHQSGERGVADETGWATFAENVRRNRKNSRTGHEVRWGGVFLLFAAVLAAAWAVFRFLLHDRFPRP